MWYLTSETDKRIIYVFPGRNIIIARSADAQNSTFAIPEDPSISRKHAALIMSEDALYLKDLGSKYGTFVNDSDKIEQNVMMKLSCDDIVKFGKMGCVWKVQEINFTTCTSTLKGENLQNLKNLLTKLGGILKNEWDDTCTYLTMPAITLTVKVVLALVQNANIVTVKYWSKCYEAITNNCSLPNPSDFIPQIVESTLNKENVSFLPSKERSSIFAGKTVIFFSRKQMEMYKVVLMKSSATALLLSETKLTKSALCDENIILIQYNLSTASQETQSQRDQIIEITNYLKSKGKRIIADAEIGLAILYCSTSKYCNPDFNFSSEVIKQLPNEDMQKIILAHESEEPSQIIYKKENVLIEDSLTSKKNLGSANESIGAFKRQLSEDDINNQSMNKKLAVETIITTKTHNKRLGEENSLVIPPSKKMALDDNNDAIFNFLKPAVAKDSKEGKQNNKLNLSKPQKRKHSTDMDEDDLFNFVDKSNKKTAFDKTTSNILEAIIDDEDASTIKKINIVDDIIDLNVLRGSKLEELMKINADMPYNKNIKKEDISDIDSKMSNIDLGSTTIIVKKDLIVKRKPLQVLPSNDGLKNFKKFTKVWPIKMQVNMVPKTSFNANNTDSNAPGEITVNS